MLSSQRKTESEGGQEPNANGICFYLSISRASARTSF